MKTSEAVLAASRDERVRPRHRRPMSRGRSGPVSVTTVDPQVMAVALKAAGGDARRLEIVSATVVFVR